MDSGSDRSRTPPRIIKGIAYRGDFSRYWRLNEQVPRSWRGPKWLDPDDVSLFNHIGEFDYDEG